jgi:hypothetical protein
MTELEQEIAHLQELRAKHRKNIHTLEEALANYGMDRPLHLVNALEFEQEQLRQVEERLAAALAVEAGAEEAPVLPAGPAAVSPDVQVTVTGSGAAAVGEGAIAVGEGGVGVGGDVRGDVVHTVIKHAERVEVRAEPTGDDPATLHRRYLAELAAEANRLPWASLDPDYADPSRGESLGLADVYTALDTTQLERVESEDELRVFLTRQTEARRIPAQEMINRDAHLLLLGDPGFGKSTLVNFLAYVLAQAGRAKEPESWLERLTPWDHGPLLPLRVILREFAAGLPAWTREQGLQALQYPVFDGVMFYPWQPSGPFFGETIQDVADDPEYISAVNDVFDAAMEKLDGE